MCGLKRDCVGDFQARNFMRDMKVGQQAFFYHSNCKEPGIAGVIKVSMALQEIRRNSQEIHHDALFWVIFFKLTSVRFLFQIVKEAYVDHTQFVKNDVHYDPSSKPENPKWSMVGSTDNVDADQLNGICTSVFMNELD